MSKSSRWPLDTPLWLEIAKSRLDWFDDDESWWYVSGYADSKAGYDLGATVAYILQNDTMKEAYDMGWEDGQYSDD